MSVAVSDIYFLILRGDVFINRLYRDDVGGNMADAFRMHITQTKELSTCPIIIEHTRLEADFLGN
uniref:Uncharacterized protein n=1 Tax=Vitis vinifera TaxID=29760 RepID=F6HTG2_VITVI